MIHTHVRKLVAVLALAFTAGIIACILWPDAGAESQSQEVFDPVAVQPVLQQLARNTTFHMGDVAYRRYGPAAAEIPASEGPETQRIEYWFTFDDQGALAELRIEVSGADGTTLRTGELEGDDLVFHDANGVETERQAGLRLAITVDSLKQKLSTAITETHEALSNRPDAPPGEVAGRAVVVLEDRKPFRSGVPAVVRTPRGEGFELPHVADLNPVDEIRRSYVLPGEFRVLRSEVVIVGADGTETVIEYREHPVFEVLRADAATPTPAQ